MNKKKTWTCGPCKGWEYGARWCSVSAEAQMTETLALGLFQVEFTEPAPHDASYSFHLFAGPGLKWPPPPREEPAVHGLTFPRGTFPTPPPQEP